MKGGEERYGKIYFVHPFFTVSLGGWGGDMA